jgi:hypothetical protein
LNKPEIEIVHNNTLSSGLFELQEIEQIIKDLINGLFAFLSDQNHNSCSIIILDPIKVAQNCEYLDSLAIVCNVNNPKPIYNQIATSKAQLSSIYKIDTHVIQQLYPYLIPTGYTKFSGGVYVDGWVIGVSGFSWYKDEFLAKTIANILIAIAKRQMEPLMVDKERKFL